MLPLIIAGTTILAVSVLVCVTVLSYQKAYHDHQYKLMDISQAQRLAFARLTNPAASTTVPNDEEEMSPGTPEVPGLGAYL